MPAGRLMYAVPTDAQRVSLHRQLLEWFKRHGRSFPWRQTRDPWQVLVAEVLLRQTFARKVVPIYGEVIDRWPTVGACAKADAPSLRELILPLGFQYRATELIAMARDICDRFGGEVPSAMAELRTLKGVGDYTASAVMVFAFGAVEPIVDRNVIRFYKRLLALPQPLHKLQPTHAFRELASAFLPSRDPREFNYALLDFAALVCTHYNPRCEACPVATGCREDASSQLRRVKLRKVAEDEVAYLSGAGGDCAAETEIPRT